MNKEESQQFLRQMMGAYSTHDWTAATTETWTEQIADLPFPVARQALTKMIRTETFPDVSKFFAIYEPICKAESDPRNWSEAVCGKCEGNGWVEIGRETTPTVMPCESCRPDQYERWKSGALAKGY